jgi:hypothetical protein
MGITFGTTSLQGRHQFAMFALGHVVAQNAAGIQSDNQISNHAGTDDAQFPIGKIAFPVTAF